MTEPNGGAGEGRFGVHLGTVTDNNDPEQRGRVRVLVPVLNAREALPSWALPRGQNYGAKRNASRAPGAPQRKPARGRFIVPEVDAQVLVTFLDGNPEVPLWEPGPMLAADVPASVKSSTRATSDRYPAKSMLLRGRSVEVIEHEAGELDVTMDGGRELRVDTKGAKLNVSTGPGGAVVLNGGSSSQRAARMGDRVNCGRLLVVPGPSGIASIAWVPPEGGAPITIPVAPGIEIHALIAQGSASTLIGGDPT